MSWKFGSVGVVREHVVELARIAFQSASSRRDPREVGGVVERLLGQHRRTCDEPVDRTQQAVADQVGDADDAVPEPHGRKRSGPPRCDRTCRMRFRIFTEPQEGATYDDQLAVALLAEELGFDAYFRSDHYIGFFNRRPACPAPPTRGSRSPASRATRRASASARSSRRSRSGNPGPLAISVAQVDAMSDGRVELGLGAGWNDREHAAYGIPFPDTGERFDRLEEQLAIITGLWTTPIGGQLLVRRRRTTR